MSMISVIIPVYNTERYLSRCIDSIIAQTYTNFEAIFVDDGSKDSSSEILEDYQRKDGRIRVLHQTNQGVTRARAWGVRQAKGEWITFVDSDDTLPRDALLHFSEHFSDDTDIIIGWLDANVPPEKILPIEEYRRRNIGRYGIIVGPYTHAFRRNIITPSAFDIPREIVMGEDMLMNIRIAFNTEKPVRVVHHIVYNYFIENSENTTNRFKDSMEYENLLHQHRLRSIPVPYQQLYMKEMIGIRVYDLFRYLDCHPFSRSWQKSAFYRELMNDVTNSGYTMSKADSRLFYSDNAVIQSLSIFYKRFVASRMKKS